MNVEERLSDALSTQARTVAFDPYAYDRIVRRRERRRLTRWVRPVGALAAAVAVVGLVAVVVRPGDTRPTPPARGDGAPGRVLVLRGFGTGAVLVDANDLDGKPARQFSIELMSIAGTGDGTTFYGLGQDRYPDPPCNSTLYRLHSSGKTEVVARIVGQAGNLALTRDGSRAAYTLLPANSDGYCEAGRLLEPDIQVRDLTTGTARTWTWQGSTANGTGPMALSWAPDDTHLAFGTMGLVGVLDTSAPGSTVGPPDVMSENGAFMAGIDGPGSACTAAAPAYLPSGELVAEVQCIGAATRDWDAPRIAVLDQATLRIGRTLLHAPEGRAVKWLLFDRTGRHAFLRVEPGKGRSGGTAGVLYRWDGAGVPKPVEQRGRPVTWQVAW